MILRHSDAAHAQTYGAIVSDFSVVSEGLSAIANSQTDKEFTSAVFGMCEPERRAACPRVGQDLFLLTTAIAKQTPADEQQREQQQALTSSLQIFGQRLISVPTECERAEQEMAQAKAQAQQAVAEHNRNVQIAEIAGAALLGVAISGAAAVAAANASRPRCSSTQWANGEVTTNCY